MEVITYSLKGDRTNSEKYYNDISVFTDEVLKETIGLLNGKVDEYIDYIKVLGIEKVSSKDEYAFELLMLGVLWQVYSGDALGMSEVTGHLLKGLYELRQKGGTLKPGIDFLRGILSTIFLAPDIYDNSNVLDTSLQNFNKLICWLSATGEFTQEVKRLKPWYEFIEKQKPLEASDLLATCITLAGWFEIRSLEVLGGYTPKVEEFLDEVRPIHYWKEDVIFCGRRRVEYHLNMVGAEVMNRAFRVNFLKTKKKILLLPACMRLLPKAQCKAKKVEEINVCMGCNQGCKINQLTQMGKENGFQVQIISHESTALPEDRTDTSCNDDVGIIGVTCTLNLIAGGWKAKDLGYAPQCVLLDYCGCNNHWHKTGIVTDINLLQLERILEPQKVNI